MKKLIVLAIVLGAISCAIVVPTFSMYSTSTEFHSGTITGVDGDSLQTNPIEAIKILYDLLDNNSEITKQLKAELASGEYVNSIGLPIIFTPYDFFNRIFIVGTKEIVSLGPNYGVLYTRALVNMGLFKSDKCAWKIYRGYDKSTKKYYFNVFYTNTDISALEVGAVIPGKVYRYSEQYGNTWAYTENAIVSQDNQLGYKYNLISGLDVATWMDIEVE